MVTIAIIFAVLAVDQGSKIYIAKLLEEGRRTIPIINDVFYLTYVENRGSAFGLMEGKRFILVGVTAIVLVVLLYLIVTKKFGHKLYSIGWTLIVAGGLGNLIDRVLRGYVIDFFYFYPINFPVFNVADISVTVGAALVIFYIGFFEGRSKKHPVDQPRSLEKSVDSEENILVEIIEEQVEEPVKSIEEKE